MLTGHVEQPRDLLHLAQVVIEIDSGCRSIVRMSIAQLVQYTSSHGVPAVMAHRIVGDHSAPRPGRKRAIPLLDNLQGLFPCGLLGCARLHEFGSARSLKLER